MNRAQLDLALSRFGPGDYEEFEHLASAFAVIDYGELRTIASPRGDGGRDALLYRPLEDETVVFQYSVTGEPADKIRKTLRRLKKTVPTALQLIYVTNQEVGSELDDLKKEVRRDFRVFLDIWPRTYFLDRMNSHPQRENASQRAVELKVVPLLKSHGIVSDQAQALTSYEERCAAVYLTLQAEDEKSGKGLTRVCFESLVRAALRDTNADSRLSFEQVCERVFSSVAGSEENRKNIERALSKLVPRAVKKRPDGTYHLAYEEQVRLQDRLAQLELLRNNYHAEVESEVARACDARELDQRQSDLATELCVELMEKVLLEWGEAFASAMASAASADIEGAQITQILERILSARKTTLDEPLRDVVLQSASTLLRFPPESVHAYLARWSESYTLFALLRGTRDVQSVVVKMYGHGRLWLDSNVLLPVFAEELLDEGGKSFTALLRTARSCGMTLMVTDGVVEELSAQMGKSLMYARSYATGDGWIGPVPFLYAAYTLSGRDPASFASWIDEFRGRVQPDEDVAAYLRDDHGVERESLHQYADSLPAEIRGRVQEFFRSERGRHTALDSANIDRMVNHDIECFLGVMGRRRKEQHTPLGFNAWWVTLDRTATRAHRALQQEFRTPPAPPSPVMSPDFLIRLLEVGPLREKLDKTSSYSLPLLADISSLEGVSQEFIAMADEVRRANEGAPRRAIRRKIRDSLDTEKMRRGRLSTGGSSVVERDILRALGGDEEALRASGRPDRAKRGRSAPDKGPTPSVKRHRQRGRRGGG